MRFRLVIFGVVIVSVCSCFLKQEAPGTGPTQPTKSVPIQGVVTLEELQGAQAMAAVMAKFYPKEVSRERDGLLSRLEIKGRGPSCIVDHQRLGKEEEEKGQLLSAGLVQFGPALQTNLVSIPENAEHQYVRKLDTGVGSGLYQVKGEGSGDVLAFNEILSMPESLVDVKIAGSSEEDDVFIFKKGQSFKIAWKSPSIENAGSISLLDVFADSATEKVQVHCIALESDLGVPGGRYWDVPVSIMNQLPVTKDGQLFLARAHVRQKKGATTVDFQGIRSYFQNIGIE